MTLAISPTAADYAQALRQLLPPGAWRAELEDGALDAMLEGLGEEFARVDGRGVDLLGEMFPTTADELLARWESVFGLPDDCGFAPTTTAGRQLALAARVANRGGATPPYLIHVAAVAGFAVTIDELIYGDVLRVEEGRCEDLIASETSVFWFRANASSSLTTPERGRLECLFRRAKPAHAAVTFVYA